MAFIDGFLGLCSTVGAGTCTEINTPGYVRQPVSFSNPRAGVSVNSTPFDFGIRATTAARAIFDAPVGGNLLLVLPHATTRLPSGPSERGTDGSITLIVSALAAYQIGEAFSGTFPAATAIGQTYDADEVVGWTSTVPTAAPGITVLPRGGQYLSVYASNVYTGVALTIWRGQLRAT